MINATFKMVRPITNARILVRTDFEGKSVSIYLENTYGTIMLKINIWNQKGTSRFQFF